MRLIDADALEEKAFFHETDNVSYVEEEDIDNAPTVDATERKKGKWEFVGLQMFVCSECKHGFRQDWLMDWRTHNSEPIFPNFCPNCGAEMRGEANEESTQY